MTQSGTASYKIPTSVQDAWSRLTKRGGSPSDLARVLRTLAEQWARASSDPHTFDNWLLFQGIKKELLTPDVVGTYRDAFADYQRLKYEEARKLIEGLALGPHTFRFFTSLRAVSTELKELAYRTGIEVSRGESLLLVLCALSSESPDLARTWIPDAVPSPLIRAYTSYLESQGLRTAAQGKEWEKGYPESRARRG